MTTFLAASFGRESEYLHVPVYLIFICVTDTFRFKVAEKIDNAFYCFLNVSIFHEMFDAVTSFTRSDENYIHSVRKSRKSDNLVSTE